MSRGGALRRDASNHVLLMSSINIRGMGDFAPNLWMLVPIFWQGIIRWGHYGYFEQIEKKTRGAPAYQVEYNFGYYSSGKWGYFVRVFDSGIFFPDNYFWMVYLVVGGFFPDNHLGMENITLNNNSRTIIYNCDYSNEILETYQAGMCVYFRGLSYRARDRKW